MFPSSEVTIMQYNSFLITSNISRNCLYTWMKRQPENLLNRHWYFVILEWCILGMLSGNLGLLLVINKLPAWFNHYSNRFFSIKAVFLLVRTQLFTHVIKFLAIGGLLMLAGSTSDTFHVKTQLFPLLKLLRQVIKDETKSLIKIQINCSMQGGGKKNPIFLECQNVSLSLLEQRYSFVHVL